LWITPPSQSQPSTCLSAAMVTSLVGGFLLRERLRSWPQALKPFVREEPVRRLDGCCLSVLASENSAVISCAPLVRQSDQHTAKCSSDVATLRWRIPGPRRGRIKHRTDVKTGRITGLVPIRRPSRIGANIGFERSGAGVEPTHRRATPVWPILKTGWATGPGPLRRKSSADVRDEA
jgi:hypothetical protein